VGCHGRVPVLPAYRVWPGLLRPALPHCHIGLGAEDFISDRSQALTLIWKTPCVTATQQRFAQTAAASAGAALLWNPYLQVHYQLKGGKKRHRSFKIKNGDKSIAKPVPWRNGSAWVCGGWMIFKLNFSGLIPELSLEWSKIWDEVVGWVEGPSKVTKSVGKITPAFREGCVIYHLFRLFRSVKYPLDPSSCGGFSVWLQPFPIQSFPLRSNMAPPFTPLTFSKSEHGDI
jgi:hypothetical protein